MNVNGNSTLKNFTVQNVTIKGALTQNSYVNATKAANVSNVVLKNVSINGVCMPQSAVTRTPANLDVVVQGCTSARLGVAEAASLSRVQVAPNPFTSELTLQLPAGNQVHTIRLVDMRGAVLSTQVRTVGQTSVSLGAVQQLAKGLYVLQLISADKTESLKVVKD